MSIVLQPVDLSLDGWIPTTLQADNAENELGAPAGLLETPLERLTSATTNGSGAFDVLMRAVKAHLAEEFESQRITGNEYSTVYLGAMTAVLQTSIQFLLNEQQARKIAAEIGLVRQQTVTELANTDDNIPSGLGYNFLPKVQPVIPSLVPQGGN
jgi:hypothetical protein